ncbi:hypothetical protein GQX74_005960 [Glossina fuscipes]|nr:hypothetical protein GQX74_005960 [Glossina fuscipes]
MEKDPDTVLMKLFFFLMVAMETKMADFRLNVYYQCAWKFNQSSALTRHLRKHTKSKPSEYSQPTQEEEEVNYRHLTNIFMYDFSKETNPISDYTQRLQLPQSRIQNEMNLLPHNIY